MSIKLKLPKDIYVELLEIKEKLINELETKNIYYEIPFDKTNESNIKETLINIVDAKVEVSVENDIIKYIKSGNSIYTNLDKMEDITDDTIGHINKIKEKVKEKFNNNIDFTIEKIDTKTMNMTLIITDKTDNSRARIQIVRDRFGDVFINTIKSI